MKICGYLQKPKRVREQKSLGNAELGLLNDTVISSDGIASCNILLKNESVWIRKEAVLLFGVVTAFSENTLSKQRKICQDCRVMNPVPYRNDVGGLSTGVPCSLQPEQYVKAAPRGMA